MAKKYSLVGQNGNAYNLMGYTANALKCEGLGEYKDEMYKRATEGDYSHLIAVCCEYLDMANIKAEADDSDEEDD